MHTECEPTALGTHHLLKERLRGVNHQVNGEPLRDGGALPEHRHDKTEELAYFVSGEGTARLYIDGELQDVSVGQGSVWYNPPGVWHSVANTGDEPLVLVFATIPNEKKGLLSFFRRISVKPGEERVVLPPEEFARIATDHDMILRPPASLDE